MPTPLVHEEEVRLPGGRRVRLLGVLHGQVLPLGRKTSRELQKRLEGHEGPLFAEATKRTFLPKGWVARAKPLEDAEKVKALLRLLLRLSTPLRLASYAGKLAASDFIRYLRETLPFVPPRRYAKAFLAGREVRQSLREELSRHLGPEPARFSNLLITFRSALMAHRLRSHMEENPQERVIAAVSGAGHTYQIKRFLENPRLVNRYARFIEQRLGRKTKGQH